MENQKPSNEKHSRDELTNTESYTLNMSEQSPTNKQESNKIDKSAIASETKTDTSLIKKKPLKPPKIEDKPFDEFISTHLIPGLKASIEKTGTLVTNIKLIEGKRPVVGGNCWMILCEISQQRKFWLCFNQNIITSDKTILLAESNSDPSIVESFLIDEKKTTLALLISRVLQRLNGQKWLGFN
tara:strand:- start:866 stop:1417 length:552 start_codon:yes stop_codon:yes gene_type:complete